MTTPLENEINADRTRALTLVSVSREALVRLDVFVEMLLKWQQRINLIAPSTVASLWTRHVADSLQLLELAPRSNKAAAPVWVDLGSGGGFPGLAVACALADIPGARMHLIESNAKKAAFLREATRQTGAAAEVHAARIEDTRLASVADVVTARALAPVNQLLTMVAPLIQNGAQALLLKGQDIDRELTEATKHWIIQADIVPSKTNALGRVLIVRKLARHGAP